MGFHKFGRSVKHYFLAAHSKTFHSSFLSAWKPYLNKQHNWNKLTNLLSKSQQQQSLR